eukprot:1707412-Amphidinium_carterae.1
MLPQLPLQNSAQGSPAVHVQAESGRRCWHLSGHVASVTDSAMTLGADGTIGKGSEILSTFQPLTSKWPTCLSS